MDSIKIDWSKPVEAVYENGTVVEAWLGADGKPKDSTYRASVCIAGEMYEGTQQEMLFNHDGSRVYAEYPKLRNVAPKEVEWGPEIKVEGKRPEWLGDDEVCDLFELGGWCSGNREHTANKWYWFAAEAFRLKDNHPYYDNTQTHTYTVAPEDEAALNASPPTPTRTALEQRMEDFVRSVAGGLTSTKIVTEARAILAELEPVDGDLLEAREIMADLYPDTADKIRNGDWDNNAVRDCLQGLRRGRALERGE